MAYKPADDALQIGELLHHFGGQVALGKQRRALGVGVAAQFLHQRDNPLGLLEIRTELGLERDVRQIFDAVRELLLLIDVPEEARVVEARLEHSLIAVLDQALGIAAVFITATKCGASLPGAAFDREIFLVMPHHRGQHFGGQFQIGRIEIAADRGGDIR